MKLKYYIKVFAVLAGIVVFSSCKKFLDINIDPDRIPSTNPPVAQLLTSAQLNLAFEGGSDLFRYTSLIVQHMSGQASQPNQTYEYDRYNITGSDENNVWSSIFGTTLSDLEIIIQQAGANGSPHYAGVAKILKAYEYSLVVDTWGDVPYTEAQKQTENLQPKYDDDETIYPKLITLLTEAVTDINAASSLLTPGANSLIYPGSFSTTKNNWIKLANTLKLRLLLHYSKKDPAFTVSQITALINSGVPFMASNADNFQMVFNNAANQRNPISQFEVSRPNYLFAHHFMVDLMNAKSDPRRSTY
ncbi:MAG: SusD/RagB family nutrient-binding outer membrane lipoprotein, partial [Chitinophagaceae bacterium]